MALPAPASTGVRRFEVVQTVGDGAVYANLVVRASAVGANNEELTRGQITDLVPRRSSLRSLVTGKPNLYM
jgi:hypothetical protein